jgi:hypothetical protein
METIMITSLNSNNLYLDDNSNEFEYSDEKNYFKKNNEFSLRKTCKNIVSKENKINRNQNKKNYVIATMDAITQDEKIRCLVYFNENINSYKEAYIPKKIFEKFNINFVFGKKIELKYDEDSFKIVEYIEKNRDISEKEKKMDEWFENFFNEE